MGEARTVRKLILYRSRLDRTYAALQEIEPLLGATDMAEMHEPVFLTYMDLDRLIEQCGLSKAQHSVVKALMDGYSIMDCVEMLGIQKQAAIIHLNRAVEKITVQNDKDWNRVYHDKKS